MTEERWIVTTYKCHLHDSEEKACAEAERLAMKCRGKMFRVLAVRDTGTFFRVEKADSPSEGEAA